MRILYLSCHSVLERSEIALFHELGHQIFSPGAYVEPDNPGNELLRPAIKGLKADPQILEMYQKISSEHPGEDFKNHLTKEFVDNFDVVIVMHMPRWIMNNWEAMKHKAVVWRSIGQSTGDVEKELKKYRDLGMKIIRYSPKEESIPNYIGSDAMIRFYADPAEYDGYTGDSPKIVNLSQALFGGGKIPSRGDHMNLKEFKAIVEGFDWKVFGPGNENAGEHDGGALSFEDLKSMLRFNRVYLYVGTRPASYSLGFIEAMMTGIPIVSVGNVLGNSVYTNQKTFEVPEIIGENGVAGFYSDSIQELRDYCKRLIEDKDLAQRVGEAGRLRAIQFFGKDSISQEWKEFLGKL